MAFRRVKVKGQKSQSKKIKNLTEKGGEKSRF